MRKCRECGANEYEGVLFCQECGRSLINPADQSTAQLPFSESLLDPIKPTLLGQEVVPVVEAQRVTFIIPSSGRRVSVTMQDEIRVGRADPGQNVIPELDLTNDNGAEYGVSRLHATIQTSHRGVALIDMNSTNGTMLNNYRLPPELPYPLHNGDEVRFGRLLVHVFFE
jgi:pSer/pThr/pTyr-binding forkhead associated (FHA) protein